MRGERKRNQKGIDRQSRQGRARRRGRARGAGRDRGRHVEDRQGADNSKQMPVASCQLPIAVAIARARARVRLAPPPACQLIMPRLLQLQFEAPQLPLQQLN